MGPISHVADGFDEVAAELLTKIQDVLVEGAGFRKVVDVPTFIEKFVPGDGDHPARGKWSFGDAFHSATLTGLKW